MENFIFEKNKGAINKIDILYSGLYALLIAIMIVFGYVFLFSIERVEPSALEPVAVVTALPHVVVDIETAGNLLPESGCLA